jgi:hypothetical protein
VAEKLGVLKAWALYSRRQEVTAEGLALGYVERDGVRHLAEWPTFGGINRGNPKEAER